jgi:hypothetical protein
MKIVPTANITEYFMKAFGSERKKARLDVSQETEFYIVNMISEFSTEKMKEANPRNEPLSLVYRRLQHKLDYETSKGLGDFCTYISGFFPVYLAKKGMLEFHIEKGRDFYNMASASPEGNREVFWEMVGKLPRIVDVLNDIRYRNLGSDEEIIRIYDLWQQTGSKRLKKMLEINGIMPEEGSLMM